MSRQMRLVAAVFVLATLMLLFFRSSLYDAQKLPMPKSWDEEKIAPPAGEDGQEAVQLPIEGSVEEEFKEEDFEPVPPAESGSGGLKDLASESEGHVPEDPSPEDPAFDEAQGEEAQPPATEEPQPPFPEETKADEPVPFSEVDGSETPDEPVPFSEVDGSDTPDEPAPFSDVDINDTPDAEPDSLAFTAVASPPSSSPTSAPGFDPTSDEMPVEWSRFAYTQYVTDSDYLCNSVMIFESLHRLGSKADRVMMYPKHMFKDIHADAESGKSNNAKLIIKARDEYGVKLVPIDVEHRDGQDDTWADSYTKLLAFNQTQYSRVLSLDSDSTILKPMDELFLMPPVSVAMPRAYWLLNDEPPKKILSSQLMLIEPSASEFARIHTHIEHAGENEYDMEIVNELYLDNAMVLPHRPYNMLSAEFRRKDHAGYLGTEEEWDPVKIHDEAKFVHFSDWPVPKPWMRMDDGERLTNQPDCFEREGKEDCTERELWNKLYEDFHERKMKVCNNKEDDLY